MLKPLLHRLLRLTTPMAESEAYDRGRYVVDVAVDQALDKHAELDHLENLADGQFNRHGRDFAFDRGVNDRVEELRRLWLPPRHTNDPSTPCPACDALAPGWNPEALGGATLGTVFGLNHTIVPGEHYGYLCDTCSKTTVGLNGEPKWCSYCGDKLTGAAGVDIHG